MASELLILALEALKPLNFKELGLASEEPLFPVEILFSILKIIVKN